MDDNEEVKRLSEYEKADHVHRIVSGTNVMRDSSGTYLGGELAIAAAPRMNPALEMAENPGNFLGEIEVGVRGSMK